MKRLGNFYIVIALISFVLLATAGSADAQRRNERQIRDLVRTLNAQVDDFQYGLDYQLRNTSSPVEDVENVHDSIRALQTKIDDLEERLNNRSDNRDDVREIIWAAKEVDTFLVQNPQNRRIQTGWQGIRTTIKSLAANYGVTPDWDTDTAGDQPGTTITSTTKDQYGTRSTTRTDQAGSMVRIIPPITGRTVPPRTVPSRTVGSPTTSANPLIGTYQIDPSRSEAVADIISGANVGADQRQDLESKLEAPEQIAIDIRGNEVTLASSKAPPASFIADGREKTENSNGKTVRLKATLRGDELTLTSLGGEMDYTVIFTSMDNGRTLKVTRRITTDYLSETVFAESFYNKTDSLAGLGISRNAGDSGDTADTASDSNGGYSSNDPNDRNANDSSVVQSRVGRFLVPSGTIMTGFLESTIDTKTTQNNERFKLNVQAPDEYRGATIEGYLTRINRSGKVSGRSNVTFNFETITLRNGERYDFAGYLQSLKDHTGKTVKIDSEGTATGGNQTKETMKRGGIGAGIGAIIGAIAGGGTGAAIGAAIGGGAGAGSVLVQGRDDLRLLKGSMMTIQATAPNSSSRRAPQDH